jgi:hypothetical protein
MPGFFTKGDLDIPGRAAAPEYPAAKERLCELYHVNAGGFAKRAFCLSRRAVNRPHSGSR